MRLRWFRHVVHDSEGNYEDVVSTVTNAESIDRRLSETVVKKSNGKIVHYSNRYITRWEEEKADE